MYYKSKRDKWINRVLEYEAVVHNDVDGTGTQFSTEQIKTLKEKYLIGTSINFSIAIVETLQAFLTANEPSPDVIPVGNSTKTSAYFHREVIKACLNANNFSEIQEQIVKDMLISGRGIYFVKPSSFYEYNNFNVVIEPLDYRLYYPDPNSKLRSHQDQEMFFIARPMFSEKAKKIYNLSQAEVDLSSGLWWEGADSLIDNPSYVDTSNLTNQTFVWVQEIYEKVKATLYITEEGQKSFTKPEPYLDRQGRIKNLVVDEREQVFIKRIIKIGNYIKDETLLPINLYPIAIIGHTWNRNPFEYGVIHNFIDLNHALNKVVSVLIENAQQSSNAGWTAPEGAVSNKAKWENSNQPGALKEYTPQPGLPDGGKPTRDLPLPLNNAFYTLFTIFKSLIEYVTGILPLLQGSAENAPDTAGATNTLANFGMQRPKLYARRIDSGTNILGKLIIQMYQAFAPEENVMRYVNNTSAMVEIMSNIRVKIEQTPEGQKIIQTNDPNGQLASVIQIEGEKEAHTIFSDVTAGEYDVIFRSASNLPSTRAQAVEFLKTLLGRMSSDAMSIAVVEALFKLADVAEADEVLRNMNAIDQSEKQVQQLTQQNEQYAKALEDLQNKLEQQILATKEAEIESAVEIRRAKADALLNEMESKIKEDKAEAKKKQVEYS